MIPPPGREPLLIELHGGHPGAPRMKSLARSLMWWPKMDQQIEKMVKHCTECEQLKPMPPSSPLRPWCWTSRPWTRLHRKCQSEVSQKETVYVRNFRSGPTWLAGCIEKTVDPVSYLVRLTDDRLMRRHQDQIRKRTAEDSQAVILEDNGTMLSTGSTDSTTVPVASGTGDVEQTVAPSISVSQTQTPIVTTTKTETVQSRRYPLRDRRPPARVSDTFQ